MPVTGSVIRDALAAVGAVGKQMRSFDELAAGADDALRQAPGLTPVGAAGFLATCALESAWFRTTTEYGSGQRYAPFIGRTFVQLTWQANYQAFGAWCKSRGLLSDAATFVRTPTSLSDYRWAWLGGVFYFESNGVWRWANAGNFLGVSQAVNGGVGRVGTSFVPNGWAERKRMFDVITAAGAQLLPSGAAHLASAATSLIEEDSVELPPSPNRSVTMVVPCDADELVISLGWTSMVVGVKFFGGSPASGAAQRGDSQGPLKVDAARPWEIKIPGGAVTAEINYTLAPLTNGPEVVGVAGFRKAAS